MNLKSFVELINEDIKDLGSVKNLSEETGIPRTTLSGWKNGDIKKCPNLYILDLYVKNRKVSLERKALYYKVCGYEIPDLDDKITMEEISRRGFADEILPGNFVGWQHDQDSEEIPIPILGRIAAGMPIYAEENYEGYEWVLSKDIIKGDFYGFLRVEGDSMDRMGMFNNSLVLVHKQDYFENGDIVAVFIDDSDATVKKAKIEGNKVMFCPCSNNPIHEPFVFDLRSDEYKIFGKVTKIITNVP